MGKASVLLLVLLTIISFAACEKDDICVEGDTPLLVILFFDVDNPTVEKPVPNLRIIGLEKDSVVNTIVDRSSSLDSIGIPLRIDQNNTGFSFITGSADDENDMETGNIDTLTFNYETKEVFISRACGFVANYEGLTDDLSADTDNWIESIEIVTSSIENSATAHVKIFH